MPSAGCEPCTRLAADVVCIRWFYLITKRGLACRSCPCLSPWLELVCVARRGSDAGPVSSVAAAWAAEREQETPAHLISGDSLVPERTQRVAGVAASAAAIEVMTKDDIGESRS